MDKLKVRTLRQLLALKPPKEPYIIEPQLLAYGGSMIIYGVAETWKSWLAINLLFSVVQGKQWLMFTTHKSKSLIVQTEQPELLYRDRFVTFTKNLYLDGSLDSLLEITSLDLKLDNPYGINYLEEAINEYKPAVVLLDCLYHVLTSSDSDSVAVKYVINGLGRLQTKYNTAFIIIHHARKEGEWEPRSFQEMKGAAELGYWADTILKLSHYNEADDIVDLTFEKTKNAQVKLEDLRLKVNRETLQFNLH